MCLIILRREGKNLEKEVYEEGFKANPDGAGMAYIDEGSNELVVDKGFFKFEDFWEALVALGDREVLIHFRNASAGMVIDIENCHPFAFNSGTVFQTGEDKNKTHRYEFALVHNGKLSYANTKDKSDTNCYVSEVIAPHFERDPFFLDYSPGRVMLTQAIGAINKFVVMRYDRELKKGRVYILNPKGGLGDREAHEKWGCWFSNSSYLKVVHPYHAAGEYDYTRWNRQDWEDAYERNLIGDGLPQRRRSMQAATVGTTYSKPDKGGWRWCYHDDCWFNIRNGAKSMDLPDRTEKPPYMKDVRYIRFKERVSKALVVVDSAPVQTVVADPDPDMPHLSRINAKRLRLMASQYVTEALGAKSNHSMKAALDLYREDVKLAFSEQIGTKTDNEVDLWIINKDALNTTNEDWLLIAQNSKANSAGD